MATQTQKISVSGMTCGHCEMSVSKAIRGLGDGIIDVKADKNENAVVVTFDDTKITTEQIKAAVNDTGIYEAA